MSDFDIVLIHHCIVQGCVYLAMAQQTLDLLYGHSLVDCHGSQCPSELVRVYATDICILTQLTEAILDSVDCQACIWFR